MASSVRLKYLIQRSICIVPLFIWCKMKTTGVQMAVAVLGHKTMKQENGWCFLSSTLICVQPWELLRRYASFEALTLNFNFEYHIEVFCEGL